MENLLEQRAHALGVELLENVPLASLTTFRIGGPARWLARPQTTAELRALRAAAAEAGIRCALIGNGSNLLAADEGFDGLILKLPEGEIERRGDTLCASGGTLLSRLAAAALEAGLTGLEFASGIPGTVGGAVVMNAGAYGGEIAQVLASAEASDAQGRCFTLDAAAHRFGYRRSVYKEHPDWVCERACFALTPGDPALIRARMEEMAARRREKQPLDKPSAGSTYKRPEGYFAGRLIEDAGLKGYTVGGAQVSEKHAGFIVNLGGATCADVLALMEHIEAEVAARFGVTLEREVRLLR